jgi:hypothetical protein
MSNSFRVAKNDKIPIAYISAGILIANKKFSAATLLVLEIMHLYIYTV